MSTAENESAWSTTAANNASSDANITWAEGQDPATVNNSARSMMAARAKARLDQGGNLTAGGSANALTVTTSQVLISAQLTGGLRVCLKAASTNTNASVTFAPDGLTAQAIKRADGTALAVGSIQAGMFLDLVYNSGTTEWWAANIPPAAVISGGATNVGTVLLTSGTWSSQATGDIVLSSYSGYRGIIIYVSGLRPATTSQELWIRLSSDGVSYDSGSNNYLYANNLVSSTQDTKIATTISIATTAGHNINGRVEILNQTSSSLFPLVSYHLANTAVAVSMGGGSRQNAQATNGVRFLFASGNISVGNYAVYGLL